MAAYIDHINQSKKNLRFLESINNFEDENWDWQVTAAFYVALHLINAHIEKKAGQSYRTHHQVDHQINSEGSRPARLDEGVYLAYIKLYKLSRRSRYLIHETDKTNTDTHLTYDKHFAKAMKSLDKVLNYMREEYGEEFTQMKLRCIELKKKSTKNYQAVDHL